MTDWDPAEVEAAANAAGLTGTTRTQFCSSAANWAMAGRVLTPSELRMCADVLTGNGDTAAFTAWLLDMMEMEPNITQGPDDTAYYQPYREA